MTHTFHQDGSLPNSSSIFVFGSNLAGRHGAGAALVAAQKFQASYGVGVGPTGKAYAIPSKGKKLEVLPLSDILEQVEKFIGYATNNPEKSFFVTRIGCGLAGYKDSEIAPMFTSAPSNCDLPNEWSKYLDQNVGKTFNEPKVHKSSFER